MFTYKPHPKQEFVIVARWNHKHVAIYGRFNNFIDLDIILGLDGKKPEHDPEDPWIVVFKDGMVSDPFRTSDEAQDYIESFHYDFNGGRC